MDDFDGYDEGSDVDNWEAEQCFQDERLEREAEAEDFFDEANEFDEYFDEE